MEIADHICERLDAPSLRAEDQDGLPILDQPLDRLYDEVFRQIERAATDDRTLEWASRMVLVARYLERIGDHSVDIGEQVVFIVTGQVRELVPSKAVRAGVED